jgi:hypothetical protein
MINHCKYIFLTVSYSSDTQGRINHMADAAYAAGFVLMGASRFTVPHPFLQEHLHFLLGHTHFRCLVNLGTSCIFRAPRLGSCPQL